MPAFHDNVVQAFYDCPSCLSWLVDSFRPTLSRTMVARMCCERICSMTGVHIELGSFMPKQANCYKAEAVGPHKKPNQLNLTKSFVSGMKYSTLTGMQCMSLQQRANGAPGCPSHTSGISHAKATCQSNIPKQHAKATCQSNMPKQCAKAMCQSSMTQPQTSDSSDCLTSNCNAKHASKPDTEVCTYTRARVALKASKLYKHVQGQDAASLTSI